MTESSKSARNELRAALREKFPREHGQLLPALHYLQHEFDYLPDWGMEVVSWHLGIPASEVYGAATSYSDLRVDRPGAHVIRICTGLSCRVAGADAVLDAIKVRLGAEVGETVEMSDTPGGTPGGTGVSLEQTACGFLCAVAPVVQIDGRWHGRANPDRMVARVDRLVNERPS